MAINKLVCVVCLVGLVFSLLINFHQARHGDAVYSELIERELVLAHLLRDEILSNGSQFTNHSEKIIERSGFEIKSKRSEGSVEILFAFREVGPGRTLTSNDYVEIVVNYNSKSKVIISTTVRQSRTYDVL